jgi:hydroxymethylglutaryl-CoA lyase
MLPAQIDILEVGPREGFQFEGMRNPHRIPTQQKIELVDRLARTGLRRIQVTSFVHPRQVPQMADAEEVCAGLGAVDGIEYSAVYLNDVGLRRALAAPHITVTGKLTLTASETFARKNQHRTMDEDQAMQAELVRVYRDAGVRVTSGSIMAAFGCNYEGAVPIDRVVQLADALVTLAATDDGELETLILADTMGWGDPALVVRTIDAVRQRFPGLRIGLHLHDTRGLGIANAHAAMQEGVDLFDSSVGGLGGCPFAGHGEAAGNVATEELVFLCDRLGVKTGVSLEALVDAAAFAERVVGHSLPSRMLKTATPSGAS